jgi:hypothetical protein
MSATKLWIAVTMLILNVHCAIAAPQDVPATEASIRVD